MLACIREFVEKKRALSRVDVIFKYKLFIVKKSSEEVKTIMFSIITDFFWAFPCLIGWLICLFVYLLVCLDERHQMLPRLEVGAPTSLFLYCQLFFLFFFLLESRLRCICCCSFCCWS